MDNVEGQKKSFVVGLEDSVNKKEGYLLAFSSGTDYKKWHSVVVEAHGKEESSAPERDLEKKKKTSLGQRAKKKMAGEFATSGLGKSVIKNILNEETSALLSAMKRIVTRESNKKKAEELEKNIIKLAVKAYILNSNKKLEADSFLKADKPLRIAFELMCKCYNSRGRAHPEQLREALLKVEASLKQAEQIITQLLQPHLSSKNMFRLATTFGYLGSFEFLNRALNDASLDEELEKLIDAMEYYTQFHYN